MFSVVWANTSAFAQLFTVFVYFTITMEAKRQLVIDLHKRGIRNIDIFRKLKNVDIGLRFIESTIQ